MMTAPFGRRRFAPILLACALGACGENALRIEYAGGVAAKAKLADAASRGYLQLIEQNRLTLNADILAMDANCLPIRAWLRKDADPTLIRNPKQPPAGWLCGKKGDPNLYEAPLYLGAFNSELKPTLALLDALGAYASGISKIVDDKGSDPVKDLTDALAVMRSAESLLGALAKLPDDARIVPQADDKRLGAVTSLIGFIQTLATESDKVKRLRLFLNGKGNADLIAELRAHLARWEQGRAADAGMRFAFANDLLRASSKSVGTPPQPLPIADRRPFADAYYARAADLSRGDALKPALDAVLDELEKADADLRRVMKSKPNFTAAEKQKIAALNRERLVQAFDGLTQILTAFKVP